jgi:hypothetical protein
MMNLENYLNDGADWQAKAVLAYLQGNIFRLTGDKYYGRNINVEVGRYENCREQGYVFTLHFVGEADGKRTFFQRNYAVYQHRNSDSIIVLISNVHTINTPGIDEMWKDKGENPRSCDYDISFSWDEISKCGEWILDDMDDFLAKYSLEPEKK